MTRLARRVVREISLQEATVLWSLGVKEGDGWLPSITEMSAGQEELLYQWKDNAHPEIFVKDPSDGLTYKFYLLEEVKEKEDDEHST